EDGIRDATVTGVQTCALPISMPALLFLVVAAGAFGATFSAGGLLFICVGLLVALGLYVYDRGVVFVPLRWTIVLGCVAVLVGTRSEERRVGKGGGGRMAGDAT